MLKTNITENHSTGHGSLLLAALAKFSGHTINKAATVTLTKSRSVTTPRKSLFQPLFDSTRAVNLSKAAATLPVPQGARAGTKAPSPPSAPASVTSTSLYRRTPAQVDDADARHHAHMRDSAAARQALLDQIKTAIGGSKGVSQ